MRAESSSGGFTLLEILVVLIVVSIGLLGVAGLLMNNMKSSANSAWRTQAAMLADEAAERLRVNNTWVVEVLNASTSVRTASPVYQMRCTGGAATNLLTSTGSCTASSGGQQCSSAEAWRNADLTNLCAKVGNVGLGGLPGGAMNITPQSDASGRVFGYAIEVVWDQRTASRTTTTPRASYVTEVRP
ncbi:type IV pilus modification protein PilV [Crenobacter cavernae]|uniref:Type IV pilus modification protein PilV n=1 Tax=Crenobacter cavernae TaxID=2290923 RepID=A0ABY0FGT0_9NEIS|nr:type IV pilus modification protein PilV [Crenobacter cavernae]RXZ45389.1 type IV pilus modification protein PilV [Crenobacter cavernae]